MPWVERMKTTMKELKSSNWIAQETRSQAANGNKLEICNLQDVATCLLHFQNLMISVEHSAKTTKSPQTNRTTKNILILFSFWSISVHTYKKIMILIWWPNKNVKLISKQPIFLTESNKKWRRRRKHFLALKLKSGLL